MVEIYRPETNQTSKEKKKDTRYPYPEIPKLKLSCSHSRRVKEARQDTDSTEKDTQRKKAYLTLKSDSKGDMPESSAAGAMSSDKDGEDPVSVCPTCGADEYSGICYACSAGTGFGNYAYTRCGRRKKGRRGKRGGDGEEIYGLGD
jgi:hypothetical protein